MINLYYIIDGAPNSKEKVNKIYNIIYILIYSCIYVHI